VAAGGILWLGGREPSAPAPPTVAVAPAPAASATPAPASTNTATVAIRFETTPSEAEVVWGGQVRGRTPMELRVPVASVPTTVILRKDGHADRPVEFVPSEARAFMLPLRAAGAPAKPAAPAASRPIRRPAATSTRPPPAAAPAPGAAPAPPAPKPKPVEGLKDPFGQ
jgi:hypothetical protein